MHKSAGLPANPPVSSADAGRQAELPPYDSEFVVTMVPVPGQSDLLVLSVDGMLDEFSVGEFRRSVAHVVNGPERLIVLDMSKVPLIDSDGFGALINLQKRLTEKGKSLALAGCQEAVRIALSLTRLEVLFPSYANVESVPVAKR
jgi:anti-anti-sigma factor